LLRIAIGFACMTAAVEPLCSATSQDYADCQQTDDIDRSISACTRIVTDQTLPITDRAAMYVRRGYGYLSRNVLDKALFDFSEAIALDANNVYAYNQRAMVYALKGDAQAALADFRKALVYDPANEQAKEGIRQIEAALAVPKPQMPVQNEALPIEL